MILKSSWSQGVDYSNVWNGSVRPAVEDDHPFLLEMLYEAAYWRTDQPRPPRDEALARPELSKILDGWGRHGDAALIAVTRCGVPVGAAWYRYWTREDHSYGFVDEATPELGIAVRRSQRGLGIGTRLLRELMRYARAAGIKTLSLSVEVENFSLKLYERWGFKRVSAAGGAWTMIANL